MGFFLKAINASHLKQMTRFYFSPSLNSLIFSFLFYSNTSFFSSHYVIVIKYFANIYCL